MPTIKLSTLTRCIDLFKKCQPYIQEKHGNPQGAPIVNDYYDLLATLQKIREKQGSIGKRLTKLVSDAESSARQIAQITEIPASTLNNWMNDNCVPTDFDAVERLATYLNTDLNYILTGGYDEGDK